MDRHRSRVTAAQHEPAVAYPFLDKEAPAVPWVRRAQPLLTVAFPGHGRVEATRLEGGADLGPGQVGFELGQDPSTLGRGVQGPACDAATAAAVDDDGAGEHVLGGPAKDRGLADPDGLGHLRRRQVRIRAHGPGVYPWPDLGRLSLKHGFQLCIQS